MHVKLLQPQQVFAPSWIAHRANSSDYWQLADKSLLLQHTFWPYSLRRGGATNLYQLCGRFGIVVNSERWPYAASMRVCINTALSGLAFMSHGQEHVELLKMHAEIGCMHKETSRPESGGLRQSACAVLLQLQRGRSALRHRGLFVSFIACSHSNLHQCFMPTDTACT